MRSTALGALARLGALTAADVQAALRDDVAAVRSRAAEVTPVLDGSGDGDDVLLAPLLHDDDPMVVEVAAFASGERTPAEPGIVAALAEVATDHDDALCREAAVAALGALGDPGGLPAILAATSDKPAVRRRAVLALAPFDGHDVDVALRRALTDHDWQVRQAAEDLLDVPPDTGLSSGPDARSPLD